MTRIENTSTTLQIIVNGQNASKAQVRARLQQLADKAAQYNKELWIYPHANTHILSADAASEMIASLNRDNVFIALHLIHELKAGKATVVPRVLEEHQALIRLVSISGASKQDALSANPVQVQPQPLSQSTYDLAPFYQTLLAIDYSGPMIIHGFNIQNNFGQTVEQHLPASVQFLNDMAAQYCQ